MSAATHLLCGISPCLAHNKDEFMILKNNRARFLLCLDRPRAPSPFSLRGVGRALVCALPRAGQETVVCVMLWPHFAFLVLCPSGPKANISALSDTQKHNDTSQSVPACVFK